MFAGKFKPTPVRGGLIPEPHIDAVMALARGGRDQADRKETQ